MFDKKSLRKNLYQNNFWKTNLHPEKMPKRYSTQKMSRNISKESLYGNLHWKKRTFSNPKNNKMNLFRKEETSALKKKRCSKKYLNRNCLPKELWRISPKQIWREVSTEDFPKRHLQQENKCIWREISTKEKKKVLQKQQTKNYLPKNYAEKALHFSKRNLYETKSEGIFVTESVQRNLYQKMFEKKF